MKTKAIQPVTPASTVFGKLIHKIEDDFSKIRKRAYELFACNGFADGEDAANWFQAERELFDIPHAELLEDETKFRVAVAVPDFASEQLAIAVTADSLTIRGTALSSKKSDSDGNGLVSETARKELLRHFDFGAAVDPDRVTASLEDGVLSVVLPKAVAACNVPQNATAAKAA